MAAIDLLPSERILWEGCPVRHQLFRPEDAFLVPFSIMWCGFAVFWEATVLGATFTADHAPPAFFALWGIPFVLAGLYLVVGRFVVRAITSRRTRYVLTDRRVVIIGGVSGTRMMSAYLNSLPPPVVSERPDGSGSLAFGAFPGIGDLSGSRNGWRAWAGEQSGTPVLWHIPAVRRVRDLVANAQAHGQAQVRS